MEELFFCAMDIGEQMLISGAEVHRVEESIKRMCAAFGFTRTDVFIITSSMVVTVFDKDSNIYTQTRRINSATTDLEKVHLLNALSRRICAEKLTANEIKDELSKALNRKTYPFWAECICYSVIAGAFTLFFGGGVYEMLVSLFIGLIVRFGMLLSDKTVSNKIFSKFFSSAIATALAFVALKLNLIPSVDMVIVGNIMTLIPGAGLTNALRDLFTGDSIAGLLRTIEAVLIALAIAAGYFIVVVLGGLVL